MGAHALIRPPNLIYLTFSLSGPSPRWPKWCTLEYVGPRHDCLIIYRYTLGPSTGGTLLPVVKGLRIYGP